MIGTLIFASSAALSPLLSVAAAQEEEVPEPPSFGELGAPRPALEPELEPAPPPPLSVRSPWSLELRTGLTLAVSPSGDLDFILGSSLGFAYTLHPNVRIGISDLRLGMGYSATESALFSLEATPFIEGSFFVDPRLELFARAGAHANLSLSGSRAAVPEAALSLRGGLRGWILDWLTIEVSAGFDVVLTDTWGGPAGSHQGDLLPNLAVSVGFRF